MAKVILSAAVGQAAGSVGGLFFSTGPFGPFVGSKSHPVNSESNAQLGIRARFQTLAKRWANTLTPVQQASWLAFAPAHQVHDSLGQLVTLTGVQTYIKLNSALLAIGQPIIDTAPGAVSASSPGLITVNPNATGPLSLTVTPTNNPLPAESAVVWSVHPITIGRKAILKHMTLMKFFAPGVAGPYDILAEWNQRFGLLLTGAVIAAKIQYTDSTTGWQGLQSINSAICT